MLLVCDSTGLSITVALGKKVCQYLEGIWFKKQVGLKKKKKFNDTEAYYV